MDCVPTPSTEGFPPHSISPYHLVWTPLICRNPSGKCPLPRHPQLDEDSPAKPAHPPWGQDSRFRWAGTSRSVDSPGGPHSLADSRLRPAQARRGLSRGRHSRHKEAEESHFQSRPGPRRGTGWEQGGGVSPQELVLILPAASRSRAARRAAARLGEAPGVPPTRISPPGQGGRRSGPGPGLGRASLTAGRTADSDWRAGNQAGGASRAESSRWRRLRPVAAGPPAEGRGRAGAGPGLRAGRPASGRGLRVGVVCGRGRLAREGAG